MTISEILNELGTYTGRFPKAAVQAAIEQREAITPELLRLVETIAADPVMAAQHKADMLPIFALYLLAQFREVRAYEPIVKLLSGPGDTAENLIGDTVAEGLDQILASVFDGNPGPLQGLVQNPEVDEFVRGSAIQTFVVLVDTGRMPRDEVVGYFRSLFREKLEREHSQAWNELISLAAKLPAPELLEEVRQAYARGFADPEYVSLEDIERDFVTHQSREKSTLITDAISEMEWWACFDSKHTMFPHQPAPEAPPVNPPPVSAYQPPPEPVSYEPPTPVRREPKIGRNEPCPCGSGKKFKKCCGQS